MKVRGWPADESGDRVFRLLALLKEKRGLRARGVQQRFFLRHVQPGSDSPFVPRIDELQSFLQSFDSPIQNAEFHVELAQREIFRRELCSDQQAHIFEVSGARLILRVGGLNAAAAPAGKVYLVADGERKSDVRLRNWSGHRQIAARRPIAGKPLPLDAGRSTKSWK